MDNKARVIKHLELIQCVINRLAQNSFWIKGWSMAFLSALIVFAAHDTGLEARLGFIFLIPILGFWALDGYFLWQERLFRELYNVIRKQDATDFTMAAIRYADKPKANWGHLCFQLH